MVERTENLQNKPLVEAIFETRWRLQKTPDGALVDPHYKLLVGRVYDKLCESYPHHESLPSSSMPDEIAANIVQHRFRTSEDGWPLVQLGPGVATVNDTEGYIWPDFQKRAVQLLDVIHDSYLRTQTDFKIHGLLLRYIDAEPFDFDNNDIWDFLAEKLKVRVGMRKDLFAATGVDESPLAIDLRFTFPSSLPKGAAHLRFARGKKNGQDALIWETQVLSQVADVPTERTDLTNWVSAAHKITHDWFFTMIEGDLLEKYR